MATIQRPPALHELTFAFDEAEVRAVLGQEDCDIDTDFMGFTDIYRSLSSLIPEQWTVVDFGCAYAPQSFYFRNHKRYYGVDPYKGLRFKCPNTVHFVGTIKDFVTSPHDLDLHRTFAICSYVPAFGPDGHILVRSTFKNLFVFYPAGDPLKPIRRHDGEGNRGHA